VTARLELRSIEAGYGRASVIRGVSLVAEPKRVTAVLGANGGGKTSTMLTISGLLALRSGDILLGGKSAARMRNDERVRAGIVQIPQGRQLFPQMSVRENVEMGGFQRKGGVLHTDFDRVLGHFPALTSRLSQLAGTLSGGEQQMVAIARALMGAPSILMLDEPSLGLAPVIVESVYEIIRKLRDEGMTILLAEQNVQMALSVSSYVYVLQNGTVVAEGTVEQMSSNDFIQKAYLG
jgi:branched-chain amino acid transport system ATP-binding protein